jgi:hypothetical protein
MTSELLLSGYADEKKGTIFLLNESKEGKKKKRNFKKHLTQFNLINSHQRLIRNEIRTKGNSRKKVKSSHCILMKETNTRFTNERKSKIF